MLRLQIASCGVASLFVKSSVDVFVKSSVDVFVKSSVDVFVKSSVDVFVKSSVDVFVKSSVESSRWHIHAYLLKSIVIRQTSLGVLFRCGKNLSVIYRRELPKPTRPIAIAELICGLFLIKLQMFYFRSPIVWPMSDSFSYFSALLGHWDNSGPHIDKRQ